MQNSVKCMSIMLLASLILIGGFIKSSYAKGDTVQNDFIRKNHILTDDHCVTPQLQRLFDLSGVQPIDNSLEEIVKATQGEGGWLRAAGKERWELDKQESHELKRTEFIVALDAVGMLQEITPRHQLYEYALLMGATVEGMRDRLSYLFKLWDDGIRFKKIIILVGERPLDPKIEGEAVLMKGSCQNMVMKHDWQRPVAWPTNEADAMQMILDQVGWPHGFDAVEIVWARVPMIQKPDGSFVRPITDDTLYQWLALNPTPGSCLVISSQPHAAYQYTTVLKLLPATFSVDVAGRGVKKVSNIAVYLDALARLLYQENKRLEQQRAHAVLK